MKTVAELISELLMLPQGAPIVMNGDESFLIYMVTPNVVSIERIPHPMNEGEFLEKS